MSDPVFQPIHGSVDFPCFALISSNQQPVEKFPAPCPVYRPGLPVENNFFPADREPGQPRFAPGNLTAAL